MDKRGEGEISLQEFKEALMERWDELGYDSVIASSGAASVSKLSPPGMVVLAAG